MKINPNKFLSEMHTYLFIYKQSNPINNNIYISMIVIGIIVLLVHMYKLYQKYMYKKNMYKKNMYKNSEKRKNIDE